MNKYTTSDNVLALDYNKLAEAHSGKIMSRLTGFFRITNKDEETILMQTFDSIYNKISSFYSLNEYSGFLIGLFNHIKRDKATRGLEFIISCDKFAKIINRKFIVSRVRPNHGVFKHQTNNLSQCFAFEDLKKNVFTYSLVKLSGEFKISNTWIDVYIFKSLSYILSKLKTLSSNIKENNELLPDLLALCLQRTNNYLEKHSKFNKNQNITFYTSFVLKHDKFVFIPYNTEIPCFLFCGLKNNSFVSFCVNDIIKNSTGSNERNSSSQFFVEQYSFTFQIIEINNVIYAKIDVGWFSNCYILQASHKLFWEYYTPKNLIYKLTNSSESRHTTLDYALSLVKKIAFINDDDELTKTELIVCVTNLKTL